MKFKFSSFISPFLNNIDNGSFFLQPLRWLYYCLAVLNFLIPTAFIITAVSFSYILPGSFFNILGYAVLFLLVCFISWVGFQIWWNRVDTIRMISSEGDENFATVAFSHLIQTSGEWLGVTVALYGFFSGLVILVGKLMNLEIGDLMPIDSRLISGPLGYFIFLLAPISGFLVVILTRFFAEQIRALASVANHTRKLLTLELRRMRIIKRNRWE